MRILWFGRSSDKDNAPRRAIAARIVRPRTEGEIALALSSLPRYRVLLLLRPQDSATADAWAHVLAPAVGERRAARIVADATSAGVGLVTTCPRELAEHYRDALIRRALPCAIEPA
ncbi:MAG TPA: hypothetical protein VF808_19730 [Ktedonobacterales bacterium]